ncbi:RlmE family RNA methyltransferase [Myxococcota bacterium]|nr:RlmE family RNA methyltransferase [Myxococcota bacterium]
MSSKMGDRTYRHDVFYKNAKKNNFASRAIYKIDEIDQRFKLFARGDRVLDLGAAPGSWTQYALTAVGPTGRVVGIDLLPLKISLPGYGEFIQGDIREVTVETLVGAGGEPFDVVVSDMAPNTTGVKFTDASRSAALVVCALEMTDRLLKPGGKFVAKIFQGVDFDDALMMLKSRFVRFKVVKPESSRQESKEVYLVAWDHRPEPLPMA